MAEEARRAAREWAARGEGEGGEAGRDEVEEMRARLDAVARERDLAVGKREMLQAEVDVLRSRIGLEEEEEGEEEEDEREEGGDALMTSPELGSSKTDYAAALGMSREAFDALPKAQRRRLRNRVSADKSRKKHRAMVQRLKAELDAVKLQNAVLQERLDAVQGQRS
ncbi:hypothetical protein PUNSTDRAFT_45062 [Punctularia strigosozonata HHB-11173 SS5]|uniref:uncharacterized protein n=1 Tax=Punctularia strigosozonata (strain HHB-11173) TaxID=741275 RepID=UPI0004418081|nr:uncharacterized protein PUNSTDRAFT_45062 [Punctularia strigosozonata HHB-11173 SS5]EIN08601.1 hypothetical protein PUNSTDRAFT_45062 [Punctularia strigosozonata HHB-11173 SS5]